MHRSWFQKHRVHILKFTPYISQKRAVKGGGGGGQGSRHSGYATGEKTACGLNSREVQEIFLFSKTSEPASESTHRPILTGGKAVGEWS